MLSEKIQALRCEKGWSQEELAKRLSVVRQTVSKWEKGLSVPDSDMIVRLAEKFDITVAQLMGENDEPVQVVQKRMSVIGWILIVLGFPMWGALVIAVLAVAISLYASCWAVVVSLWASFAAAVGGVVGGAVGGTVNLVLGNAPSGLVLIGGGLVCAGLSIFLFFGCKAATVGMVVLTKKLALWIKGVFVKKEVAQ